MANSARSGAEELPSELTNPEARVQVFEGNADALVSLLHVYLTLTV
jgi:hypothetical protein